MPLATPASTQQSTGWWRNAVVYQIYIRSFADGNGDGTGDLAGLLDRLDYLRDLGVNALWINPWYTSPLRDGGYDVADYRQIDTQFGTLDDADRLFVEAHSRGIKVLVDLVPNHTSSDHAWFREALAAAPGDPARERYIFRDGKGPDGSEPPSDWQAVFGGSAWERVPDGQWYLHLFDASQPDLNWEHPEVLEEFDEILRFWLDRGADGFRVDVAHSLIKDTTFPDVGPLRTHQHAEELMDHPHWDRDGVHEINRRWRAVLDEYDNRMMVAEAWVHAERLPLYLRADEYHQSFDFHLLETGWNARDFAAVIKTDHAAAESVGAAPTWVLSNHDVMRHATRYGLPQGTNWREWPATGPRDALDAVTGARRARAAALILLSLPGSAYIYQGEELGLPEVWDLPAEVLEDPIWERSAHTLRGRDGCRVPLPWTADGPSFGFGTGPSWLPQPAGFKALSAAEQADDPSSMLTLYRQALRVRAELLADSESLEMLDHGPDVLSYRRGTDVVCIANMGADPTPLPDGELLLSSGPLVDGAIPADTAAWFRSA